MQNRYTGDIGDFGKFLLLKHLFPKERIATIWYLYPDETHNSDGSHTVEAGNLTLYGNCYALDPLLSEQFNNIHLEPKRHVGLFETLGVLENGVYFKEGILGEEKDDRKRWLEQAIAFLQRENSSVVCLDPDNGVEPASMEKFSRIKQGKYATLEEIERFFALNGVEHVMIYQHFNRLKKHDLQMAEAKEKFTALYQGRAEVKVIRHNPVQARFYILLSKTLLNTETQQSLASLRYEKREFFSFFEPT